MKACERCGAETTRLRYCSKECYAEARAVAPRDCPTCGITFVPRFSRVTFCSKACSKAGPNNPQWKGDAAPENTKRMRAHQVLSLEGRTCEFEGCDAPAKDRHHIDGDTGNNDPNNLKALCRRHHMLEDGRLTSRNEHGQFSGWTEAAA